MGTFCPSPCCSCSSSCSCSCSCSWMWPCIGVVVGGGGLLGYVPDMAAKETVTAQRDVGNNVGNGSWRGRICMNICRSSAGGFMGAPMCACYIVGFADLQCRMPGEVEREVERWRGGEVERRGGESESWRGGVSCVLTGDSDAKCLSAPFPHFPISRLLVSFLSVCLVS